MSAKIVKRHVKKVAGGSRGPAPTPLGFFPPCWGAARLRRAPSNINV